MDGPLVACILVFVLQSWVVSFVFSVSYNFVLKETIYAVNNVDPSSAI